MIPLLLDTCALIWLAEDKKLTKIARDAIATAVDEKLPICISPISGWEVGLLMARGRLNLPIAAEAWFVKILSMPLLRVSDLSIRVLFSSSFLPGLPPNDPADRIIIATARENGFCLITRDKKVLHYAEQGHVQAIAC